jgi:dCMP deaminase
MTTHNLKTHPEPFAALISGEKTCEFRLNDRNYQKGDLLRLQEWVPEDKCYTGLLIECVVTHVLLGPAFGIPEGYALLSINFALPNAPSDWTGRFLKLAGHIATWSKDPSTKVGCVIVGQQREILSVGYNGFPRGVADDGRLAERGAKYPLIVHAEENAILNATRTGSRIMGGVAYVTFAPCSRCARGLIQAGIAEVVSPDHSVPERWKEDLGIASAMLDEAGVRQRIVHHLFSSPALP